MPQFIGEHFSIPPRLKLALLALIALQTQPVADLLGRICLLLGFK
ncbi:MAG TPA: hypothetical protein VMK05_04305 [Burkholderiales bacterium]|nr:hypothetical protein [Burkholderiales bacterium]